MSAITVTSNFLSFTHKMAPAAKTSWHRYGTKLRHFHPMYRERGWRTDVYIEVLGVAVGMPVKVAVVVRHARVTLRLAVKRTVVGASSRPGAGHVIQHDVHVDTAPYTRFTIRDARLTLWIPN